MLQSGRSDLCCSDLRLDSCHDLNPPDLTAAASLLSLSFAMADVKLAPLFTDNMMLQRDKPVRVWCTADAAEAVSVTLAGKTAATKADAAGAWIVELPALKEGRALELQVKGNNELALKNIIMGDIWVCSGPFRTDDW